MKNLLFVITALLFSINSYGQGCSDAGFCSLGALKNNIADSSLTQKKFKSFDLGLNFGLGEQQTFTLNPYIIYNTKVSSSVSFQSKLTATYATGFLGDAFNIGDVYGTFSYSPRLKTDNTLSFIGGVKVPLSSGNSKNADGRPLPLDYQASIGSYDGIAGINYIIHRSWEFDAAIQAPLIQINKSTFFPDEFTDPRIAKFPSTNDFRRKSDLLGRVGYYFYLYHSSFIIKPSLSAIYHVGNDTYENRFGGRTTIDGSQGLTLNGSIVATKQLSNGNKFEIVVGSPFIVRKERPDGLTRSGVINFQYTIAF